MKLNEAQAGQVRELKNIMEKIEGANDVRLISNALEEAHYLLERVRERFGNEVVSDARGYLRGKVLEILPLSHIYCGDPKDRLGFDKGTGRTGVWLHPMVFIPVHTFKK